ELLPHYKTAQRMLGVAPNPQVTHVDEVIRSVASEIGRQDGFQPTNVGVFFGEPGKTVRDPYFDGAGPDRTGCVYCGGCMLGCRHNAKNTLDKNYLHLAERRGLIAETETEVVAVRPIDGKQGSSGYRVEVLVDHGRGRESRTFLAKRVIFAGGV